MRWLFFFISFALASAACGGGDDGPCDVTVTPGASIDENQTRVQTALVDAQAGQTLCFEGSFQLTDELSLTQDGVRILGVGGGATLDFATQEVGANGIHVQSVEGFTIENITVMNTPGDGVRVTESRDVVFRNMKMIWDPDRGVPPDDNGAYGLYPVTCENVLIEGCEVSGARDAGIYVGQSRNIVVRNNHVYGNVAGIEIENSFDADVYENDTHDNTAGILVFDLPGLPAGQGGRVKVHHNSVTDNNLDSFAEIGTIVSYVPDGIGIMVLASDDVEVHDNVVTGNESTGFLLVSYELVVALGAGSVAPPEYDPNPENIFVHDNAFDSNGAVPSGLLSAIAAQLEDMVWDGITEPPGGTANLCIRNNGEATFRNASVIFTDTGEPDFGEPSFDLAPYDCEGTALPEITLSL